MSTLRPAPIASGYMFPESPRWWDGQLYFSDVYGKTVYRMGGDGSKVEEVAHLDGMPSGLGELPDGRRVVVISCIDNLVKGAAGQAVQNMNLMFGLEETLGLI